MVQPWAFDDEIKNETPKSKFKRNKKKAPMSSSVQAPVTFDIGSDEYAPQYHASDEYFAVVQKHRTIFSPLIVVVCFFFLLWMFGVNGWKIEPMSENPSAGVSVSTMIQCGAKEFNKIVYDGEGWRLLSASFLHAGIIHFLFNMLAMISIGSMLECDFGWLKVAFIFLISGVFATIVSAIFLPDQVMVGASGAIFGLVGTMWADMFQNWRVKRSRCTTLVLLFLTTAINILLGLMPYLDNFAHCGGLVMGFFVSLPLIVLPTKTSNGNRVGISWWQRLLQVIGAVGTVLLLVGGFVILYTSTGLHSDEWCPWCKSISCVEFPPGDNPLWRCDDCNLHGFQSVTASDGTVIGIVCPDGEQVEVDSCNTSSRTSLTTCCIDMCL